MATTPQKLERQPSWQWSLWAVWNFGARIGYLVTSGERVPRPIAFVPGSDGGSLRAAGRIRIDHSFAGRCANAIDLRDFGSTDPARADESFAAWRFMHQRIIERTLVPLDARGFAISNHDQFCAGMYSPVVVEGRWMVRFCVFTHGLFEVDAWPMIVGGAVQQTVAQKKRHVETFPHAAQPASKCSERKGVTTAA